MSSRASEWTRELPAAITVCDATGTILAMNDRAQATFAADGGAALIGRKLQDCHPPRARAILEELLVSGRPNHYTIRKAGQRKIIHQLPWYQDGALAGLVELSIPIPDELPEFDRG